MKKTMLAVLAATAALGAGPAAAAMYRCGNAFQDRPCEDSAQQQLIKPGRGAARPAASAPTAATRAAPQPVAPAAVVPAPAVPATSVPATSVPAAAAARAARNPMCANLLEQRTAIEARLRSSTKPATTEMLQRQRGELDKSLADAGC